MILHRVMEGKPIHFGAPNSETIRTSVAYPIPTPKNAKNPTKKGKNTNSIFFAMLKDEMLQYMLHTKRLVERNTGTESVTARWELC